MESDDESARESTEPEGSSQPLLPAPSTRHRWAIAAALLVAAALSVWRCG